jgi:hypothetical protein
MVPVEVEVEGDTMRAPLGEHKGRAGGKEGNHKICRRRWDDSAQEVSNVEASGVEE